MKVRFLLDENMPPRLKIALLRLGPTIEVLRVGDSGAPPLGTPDPDILNYLDLAKRILITANRVSMPDYLASHWKGDGHIWGLLWVRPGTPIGLLAQELHLIREASEAEEWVDRLEWIPF